MIATVAFGLAALAPVASIGAIAVPATFSITPANPSSADVVHVEVDSGLKGCFPTAEVPTDGVDVQLVGSQINILLSASNCPIPSPNINYRLSFDIGPLPPGTYEFALSRRALSIVGTPGTYELVGPVVTSSFEVTGVAIPSLGTVAMLLLISALAMCGVVAARR